ncbi:putative isochorismatase family protein [Fusarium oxysporum f. sp. albedinis]|nr:putative isochorismatase family protein [Fusarium oxysporum f. sp. albedinis]
MEATRGYPQGDTSAEVIINLRTRGNFLKLILACVLFDVRSAGTRDQCTFSNSAAIRGCPWRFSMQPGRNNPTHAYSHLSIIDNFHTLLP